METGWVEFRLRTYDPQIGRWINADPEDVGFSPYIGMGNNPFNMIDADGADPDPIYYMHWYKNIIYKDFLSHSDIAALDINIASLLPEWHHISVPSKAVTAVCCGSVLLLNAGKTSDAWQMLHKAAWIVEPDTNYHQAIKNFLSEVSKESILAKRQEAQRLALACRQDMEQEKKNILTYVESLS